VRHTREHLARFKCPSRVSFVSELPRNAAGKVLKAQLRAPWLAGRDRRV
jgi:acyl-coenzyme A synthetase/AMP-(fatty) acid ligase